MDVSKKTMVLMVGFSLLGVIAYSAFERGQKQAVKALQHDHLAGDWHEVVPEAAASVAGDFAEPAFAPGDLVSWSGVGPVKVVAGPYYINHSAAYRVEVAVKVRTQTPRKGIIPAMDVTTSTLLKELVYEFELEPLSGDVEAGIVVEANPLPVPKEEGDSE